MYLRRTQFSFLHYLIRIIGIREVNESNGWFSLSRVIIICQVLKPRHSILVVTDFMVRCWSLCTALWRFVFGTESFLPRYFFKFIQFFINSKSNEIENLLLLNFKYGVQRMRQCRANLPIVFFEFSSKSVQLKKFLIEMFYTLFDVRYRFFWPALSSVFPNILLLRKHWYCRGIYRCLETVIAKTVS